MASLPFATRADVPHRRLVSSPLLLTAFFNMVGRMAYDTAWADIDKLTPTSRSGAAGAKLTLVADDISMALASGLITASIKLSLASPIRGDMEQRALEDSEIEVEEEECELIGHVDARIAATFWDEDRWLQLDWSNSELDVSVSHLKVGQNKKGHALPLTQLRPDLARIPDSRLSGQVSILAAGAAIDAMSPGGGLSAAEWRKRYAAIPNRLADEVVAAAWRWMALETSRSDEVGTSALAAAMDAYLQAQGLDGDAHRLGDKALEAIARKILQQRQTPNLASMVLLNSRSAKKSSA